MAYQEKSLQCVDCDKTFPFTVGEQEFFASKGLTNDPKRCPACRSKRRSDHNAQTGVRGDLPPRQMYSAVCAQCGKETQIPFQPRGDRPVYCRDCYTKSKGLATGIAAGTANITASLSGVTSQPVSLPVVAPASTTTSP